MSVYIYPCITLISNKDQNRTDPSSSTCSFSFSVFQNRLHFHLNQVFYSLRIQKVSHYLMDGLCCFLDDRGVIQETTKTIHYTGEETTQQLLNGHDRSLKTRYRACVPHIST